MEQKQLKYQKEMGEKQLEFQKQFFELTSRKNSIKNEFSFSQNTIWNAIEDFSFSPEEDITFASYLRIYEDLYKTYCGNCRDLKKIRLLLSKLGANEHTKFVNYILPNIYRKSKITDGTLQSEDFSFSEKMKMS